MRDAEYGYTGEARINVCQCLKLNDGSMPGTGVAAPNEPGPQVSTSAHTSVAPYSTVGRGHAGCSSQPIGRPPLRYLPNRAQCDTRECWGL